MVWTRIERSMHVTRPHQAWCWWSFIKKTRSSSILSTPPININITKPPFGFENPKKKKEWVPTHIKCLNTKENDINQTSVWPFSGTHVSRLARLDRRRGLEKEKRWARPSLWSCTESASATSPSLMEASLAFAPFLCFVYFIDRKALARTTTLTPSYFIGRVFAYLTPTAISNLAFAATDAPCLVGFLI